MNNCDCIIPFYNEATRPLYVVGVLLKTKFISKIIVIDDGSSDNRTYLELKNKFPQIKVIRLENNQGKAQAIKEGLKFVTSEYVLLIDGDLTNLISAEIEIVINEITSNQNIDMVIFRRVDDKTVVLSRFLRHDIIFSGQRILKTNELKEILNNQVIGYNLEAVINSYMIKYNKEVFWMPLSVHNLFKNEKWGLKKGFFEIGIPAFIGFMSSSDIIYQTLFFCRKKLV